MKKLLLLTVFLVVTVMAFAQRTVSGKVVEQDTQEAVIQATAAILSGEKVVANAVTNTNGGFSFKAPRDGSYTLKITYVGFKTYTKKITIKDGKDYHAGTITLEPDAIMLKGATVTAHASKVTLKADTFMYNASAFRTPEGSVVEELVKRLPGAEVSDDGTIKINGKEVKKILVDGKEFMTGDTKTALQNLPTNIIERIKAYDQQSDLSRVSGIQDGEEETVLDFGIKRGMNRGIMANIDLAAGTQHRYAARGMGAVMQNDTRVMLFGRANNVNDQGFPGGGGGGRWGGQRQGLNAAKMLGVNINYEKKDKLKIDGSVRWNHSDGDQVAKRASQQIYDAQTSVFSNSNTQNFSRSNNWNGQMRIEWQPDTMTNILFRPTARYNSNDGLDISDEATFDSDPYTSSINPLDEIDNLVKLGIVKNTREQNGVSYSDSKNLGGMLQFNRRLSSTGRNITLQLNGGWSEGNSQSISDSYIHYYQLKNYLGEDSVNITKRYSVTPTKNWNYRARFTYSEPIFRQVYLQFIYQFRFDYTKNDRSTYDFSHEKMIGSTWVPDYRSWDAYLQPFQPIEKDLDRNLSRFSEYKNYTHNIELMLRIVRKTFNFNVGVRLVPQKSHFIQDYQGYHADTTRTVTNITPTVDFRWKRSEVSQLRVQYNANTTQPSMSDLLAIRDDSDPLNIKEGNPGLKPSFTQNLRVFYNNYTQRYQRSIATWAGLNTTSNAISNKVTLDPQSGARVSRPENIDGNWNGYLGMVFNTAIDTAGYFNVNTFTNVSYNHYVGYASVGDMSESQKSITNSLSLNERLATSYRNEWLEIELNGSVGYTRSRNDLQENNNLDTWQFTYGGLVGITAPWGTALTTNINMQSRRGYSDASLNTNELIWNAQVSQGFLKGKVLTISLQLYDILHRQSTLSSIVSAMGRTDTEYNSIASYGMLHVIYRLNLFGGKNAFGGGPGGPGGPGGRPGGFGGGRPGGGPGGGRPGGGRRW
jgi:hypothetical protein